MLRYAVFTLLLYTSYSLLDRNANGERGVFYNLIALLDPQKMMKL